MIWAFIAWIFCVTAAFVFGFLMGMDKQVYYKITPKKPRKWGTY